MMQVPDTRSYMVRPHVAAVLGAALVSVAMVFALASPATALAREASASPSVVGGEKAKIENFPFQVALYDPKVDLNPANSQFCGGVILDATHVLTAAHCVFDEATGQASSPGEIEVLAGTASLNTSEPSNTSFKEDPVTTTSFDPLWDRSTGEHDLGLLTLEQPLNVGEPNGQSTIASIPLLKEAELNAQKTAPTDATVSGWGDEHAEPPSTVRPSYATELKSGQLPLVSNEACAHDYEMFEHSNPGSILPKPGPDFVCAGGGPVDACYGDSGGPLVVGVEGATAPADLRLLGTVDLGVGCGQPGLPGLFQSVMQSENVAFIGSAPPQAPTQSSPASVVGTAQPGQTLTCQPGKWGASPSFAYRFILDESTYTEAKARALSEPSSSPIYVVPSTMAAGSRIFCEVRAANAGGFGEAFSPDVTLSAAPATPSPQPSPTPTPSASTSVPTTSSTTTTPTTPSNLGATVATTTPAPPTLRVLSKTCKHVTCIVQVLASQGTGLAAVSKVEALLTFLQAYPCHEGHQRFTCTRTVTRRLSAKPTPAGRFVIEATGLKPTSYELMLTAVDKAGVRQHSVTRVALAVTLPHSKR